MKTINMRKQVFAALVLFLVAIIPMVIAQETSSEATGSADVETVSLTKLRFRGLGETINDFVFSIKSAFTFSEESRVELLGERNAELKARQGLWLETKEAAMAEFNEGTLSAEEKQEILAKVQDEHEALIKEHVSITQEINDIKASARVNGRTDLEEKANLVVEHVSNSGLALGLNLGSKVDLASDVRSSEEIKEDNKGRVSEIQAEKTAETEFKFEADNVALTEVDGREVYIVTGVETEARGNMNLKREYEIWVDAATGMITFVDLDVHLESKEDLEAETEAEAEAELKVNSNTQTRTRTNGFVRVGY